MYLTKMQMMKQQFIPVITDTLISTGKLHHSDMFQDHYYQINLSVNINSISSEALILTGL